MGDFPLMTDKGTFVINGTERVVVSQLVRSPASTSSARSTRPPTRTSTPPRSSRRRGAWLEFEIDKKDIVGVRVDRKRKQNVTVLLKALGWDDAKILEELGDYESINLTLEKDNTTTQDEALLDIYRKLRPGEPPTREAAQTLLDNLYFNAKRYDLAKVGRYKVNKKLGLERPLSDTVLTVDDIVADDQVHRRAARRRDRGAPAPRAPSASRPTTSTTSATVVSAPSASSSRTRSAPVWPAWSASSASA